MSAAKRHLPESEDASPTKKHQAQSITTFGWSRMYNPPQHTTSKTNEDRSPQPSTSNSAEENEPPLWVIQLTPFLRLSIQKWKGEWRVDLRRYEVKEGKWAPTKKGVSMTLNNIWELIHNLQELTEAFLDVVEGKQTSTISVHLKGNIYVTIDPSMSVPLFDIRKFFRPLVDENGQNYGTPPLTATKKGVSLRLTELQKLDTLLHLLPSLLPEFKDFIPCHAYHITNEDRQNCQECTPPMHSKKQ